MDTSFETAPWHVLKFTAAESGKIKDISKLLPKYAPKMYNSYSKEEIEGSKIDGKLFAVPRLNQQLQLEYAVVRDDPMKKYNLPEIKTLDDYSKYLETIKNNEKGMAPVYPFSIGLDFFYRANDYALLDATSNWYTKRMIQI